MKKLLLVFALCELIFSSISANPGDTTWVTIYNQRKLTYYGNYDTSNILLPTGKRYRKIRLHYILGRYSCPAGSQYCGSWDYTTQIYAKPQNNDTVEIARIITPYATDWLSTNRKHDYVVDVTDYASILDGTMDFRFGYQGYSYGFTITLKLEFIEGVPPMDALKVKNIYDGYYAFGKTADPIENHLTEKSMIYSAPGAKAMIKNIISGHGSDDADCSEFCSKYYQLKLNGSMISQKQIWRNDCGLNDVYPQTGTWLYERANWCPGAVVWPIYHDVSSLTTANSTFSVDVDMEPYTASNQSNAQAGYNFVSQLISYSAPNHSVDVSIEDIISPTINENYYRSNPACNNPRIKIRNVGTNTVTQVVFNYGLLGGTPLSYTWTGSLDFLAETEVTFPSSLSIYTNNISNDFNVSITSVNGGAGDQNSFNNTYVSKTTSVSVYPPKFVVVFSTNNATNPNTTKNETTWKIEDENGNVVASRINVPNSTYYLDTLTFTPGCYKLIVDDSGCDGFSWWAYQYYTPNPGNGSLRFSNYNANNSFYVCNGDFGCQQIKYFRVSSGVGIAENTLLKDLVDIYPNPSSDKITIRFELEKKQRVEVQLTDLTGKIIREIVYNNAYLSHETLNTADLSAGTYLVKLRFENGETLNKKLIIQH